MNQEENAGSPNANQVPDTEQANPESPVSDVADPTPGEQSASSEPHEADSSTGEATAEAAVAGGFMSELESLRAQVDELNDRYVRAMAEMENVRRRSSDEVAKARKFAVESFAESLIPVKDSLEMALKVESPSIESLREGTEATLRQLESAFDRNSLKVVNPLGERFDPNLHQAISMVPADQTDPPVEPNHVATVLQCGYLIHDRVLRPALVMVSQA